MKRVLSLILCLILLASVFTGCSIGETDDGAKIPVYFSEQVASLDPAVAFTDEGAIKILGLVYEGLFRINSKGKLENALAKKYEIIENADTDTYMIEISLNDTMWSDGRSVSANDIVYAWKRILEPEFSSDAAAMLYDIKNARDCKKGDCSIDDLGVVAAEEKLIQIYFDAPIDYDRFLETLASPALVPLREDKVSRLDDWASYYATMVTNGPFYVKIFEPGDDEMILERSSYYYRDIEEDKYTKYVKPFRLIVDFSADTSAQLASYEDGILVYNSFLPLESRADYSDTVDIENTLCTYSYFFNTEKAPFDDADVRKALTLAVDREAVADIVTFAEAAGGLIPDGVFNTGRKDSFREEGGNLLPANADMSEAKSLISSARVAEKNITLSIRPKAVDRAVADYVKGVWEELGFTVEIKELGTKYYTNIEYNQYEDLLRTAVQERDFDVIAYDSQIISTDAFQPLATFAPDYSGQAMDLASGNFDAVTHFTGYNNKEYNDLIDKAFAEQDREKRASFLHEAEEILLSDAPVMPLFVYQNAYLQGKDLKGVDTDYYGYQLFTGATLKNQDSHYLEAE